MDHGAMIVPGAGHVLVVDPFAMVMSGNVGDAQAADEAFCSIAKRRAWSFETVADALQELVVNRELKGVAAVLTTGSDPVVFIFDEAMAIFDGSAHSGAGRDEWVTEMVMGHSLELRLAGQSTMPPQHGTSLRDGLVPGAGLSLELALTPSPEHQQPPPPRFNAPPRSAQAFGTGPLAQYGYQPPPPTFRPPPPPHESAGRDAPGRVHHQRPPPPPE
ncbi:MAG: hypothetical protein HKN24_02370 [Acidimicrobiales bacterium]|nr:hypothetical protein [Acidimicrobiales bacterium]